MNIKSRIDRIPGGMMIVFLFLGARLNTLAPNTGEFFGSFTNGLPLTAWWARRFGALSPRYQAAEAAKLSQPVGIALAE